MILSVALDGYCELKIMDAIVIVEVIFPWKQEHV